MSTTGMLSYTFVWIVPPQMTHGNGDGLSSDQVATKNLKLKLLSAAVSLMASAVGRYNLHSVYN